MEKRIITWSEIKFRIKDYPLDKKYWGIPRGGQYIAALLNPVDTPEEADFIVDDLIDSGRTFKKWMEKYPDKIFLAPFDKRVEDLGWLVFPWERWEKEGDIKDYFIRIAQYLNIKIKIDDE